MREELRVRSTYKVWILHKELNLWCEERDADRVWSLISVAVVVGFDAMACVSVARSATGVTGSLAAKCGRKRDYGEQRQ